MANFRKGTALIKEAAESKGGVSRFTPNIYWKDGDVKTIAFRTPADDIPKIRIHQAVRIPDDNMERGYRYDNFLCRKDPSMIEESGGHCPLCDDIGHAASERFVALAVELEPVTQGKRTSALNVKYSKFERKDGTEVEIPRWGLVVQASKNFFAWLGAYDETKGDITEKAFEVQRQGGSKDTKYFFFPEDAPLPDFSPIEDQLPDLEDLLEQMGSDEKYAQLDGVEPGSQIVWGSSVDTTKTDTTGDRQSEFDKLRQAVGAETY